MVNSGAGRPLKKRPSFIYCSRRYLCYTVLGLGWLFEFLAWIFTVFLDEYITRMKILQDLFRFVFITFELFWFVLLHFDSFLLRCDLLWFDLFCFILIRFDSFLFFVFSMNYELSSLCTESYYIISNMVLKHWNDLAVKPYFPH